MYWDLVSRLGASNKYLEYVEKMFDEMLKKTFAYWNTKIYGYYKWGIVFEAIRLLNMISERNIITWAIIVMDLTKDRHPRTRLQACMCLIIINNMSPCNLQDIGIKTKSIYLLLELLDDHGHVGDDASIFPSLFTQKEDLEKLASEANALDKLHNHLPNYSLHYRCFEGILLVLANPCSNLESCRSRFLS